MGLSFHTNQGSSRDKFTSCGQRNLPLSRDFCCVWCFFSNRSPTWFTLDIQKNIFFVATKISFLLGIAVHSIYANTWQYFFHDKISMTIYFQTQVLKHFWALFRWSVYLQCYAVVSSLERHTRSIITQRSSGTLTIWQSGTLALWQGDLATTGLVSSEGVGQGFPK